MELKHHFSVPSSLADTWHSFNQLEEIAPCFPGATLTGVDGDTFTGTVKIKLGPIAMLYTGTGRFLSRDEATHTVVIEAQGKDKRGNGTAGATVTAALAASGDGTTVDVSTDMNVTGKPAQFGRGVIQDISDKLLEQFVECVIKKAQGPAEPEEVPAPVAATATAPPDIGTPPAPAARHDAPPVQAIPAQAAPELDLGSAVLPVLAKRFGPAILGVLAVLAVIVWCSRGRKR
ncbi:SRPBCC family protein [Arthrobacter sp. BF1]|uniref:SRPBCC family protein n=1 Tax=Arthrobacter sp. BF1 TaxID=2821145 RepID=UPI001C4F4E6A|nr:SRPBCC family protein [Arthrobacter sp. BF1]